MQERNSRWNLVRKNWNAQMHIMHVGTGERANTSMPARWVHPGQEDGAILLRGVMWRGAKRTGSDWATMGYFKHQGRGQKRPFAVCGHRRWTETGQHLRHPQVPVSNTGDDEDRRRYCHQEGDGEEDGWVRAEPHRKRADRTPRPLNQMELDERCFRCLTHDHHTKECRDPLV